MLLKIIILSLRLVPLFSFFIITFVALQFLLPEKRLVTKNCTLESKIRLIDWDHKYLKYKRKHRLSA